MTTEEHIERVEKNLHRLAVVQDQMMDVLGMTVEGERRLATRMERIEELQAKADHTLAEAGEKLNALIAVVDGFIRGKN
jgi:hypothetical protein